MKKKKKIVLEEDEQLSRKQKIKLAALIYERMVEGESDGDIIADLGISPQQFSVGKKFLLSTKGEEEERLHPKERFARYLIEQERNMNDLSDLIINLNSKTQYSVIAGAIRMRSDILNKIIDTGQTLGVISKEPERRVLVGGISVSDMKEGDLRRGVLEAIGGLGKMIERYGQGSNLRALSPGPLHHGEAVDVTGADQATLEKPAMREANADKKNRAATGKRAAGRRRVRE